MESVYEALKSVQAAVAKVKTEEKKHLTETVAQLSSHLVLLPLRPVWIYDAQYVANAWHAHLDLPDNPSSKAYDILCDSAASHQVNQQKLRDKDILGDERLGSCIWRTKDYLALEGLLNVFARALPSTHNSESGRAKRTAYIQTVFVTCAPPELISTGEAVADLLENVPTSDWEKTALKIVDVLAKANVTFPQPFSVDEVIVYGVRCPSDRLYADGQTFLANDGQYESLEFEHSSIRHISVEDGTDTDDVVRVRLSLERPPKLGKDHIKEDSGDGIVHDADALFIIDANDRNRFLKTLESRNLDHLLLDQAPLSTRKLSIAAKPANLELDHAGRIVPELSQEERIEAVSQFYRTDEPSDDITTLEGIDNVRMADDLLSPLPRAHEPANLPKTSGMASVDLASERHPTMEQSGSTSSGLDRKPPLAASRPLSRSGSHLIRAAVFGLSDEELSDISDCESPIPLKRSGTGASLVRGRLSFQPLHTKSTGTSSSATRVARGGIGIVVLDSDDDSPPAAPGSPRARRNKKAALIRPPTLNDSQVVPAEGPTLYPAAVPAAAPVTLHSLAKPAVSSPLPGDHTLVSSDILGKVLRFSDIPAPDFNAPLSSPAIVPRSALKSAFAQKNAVSGRLVDLKVLDSTAATKETQPGRSPSLVDNAMKSVVKARNVLDDLAPASSSPTPGPKKSVKANLRKREGVQASTIEETQPPTSKRKHAAPQGPAEIEPLIDLDNETKQDVAPPTVIANERSESQVLRPRTTAATRATRKYHARKGRTSSPPSEAPLAAVHAPVRKGKATTVTVDYDALPSPPRASNAPSRPSPPAPMVKPVVKPKVKADARHAGGPNPQAIEGPPQCDVAQAPAAASNKKARMRKEKTAATNGEHVEVSMPVITEVSEATVATTKPVVSRRRPKRRARARALGVEIEEHASDQAEAVPPCEQEEECAPEIISVSQYAAREPTPDTATIGEPERPARQCKPVVAEDNNARRSAKKSAATPWDAAFEDCNSSVADVVRAHDVPVLNIETTIPVSDSSVQVARDHKGDDIVPASKATSALTSAATTETIVKATLNANNPADLQEDTKLRKTAMTPEASSARSVANTAEGGPARETRLLLQALEELPTSPPARPQCPPIRAKREVDMIDLTLDTPSKPVSQGRDITVESKGRSPLLVLSADILRTAKTHYRPTEDELMFLEHGDPEDTKLRFRSVRFARDDKMSTGYMRHHHTGPKVRSIREREMEEALREKVTLESKYRASPPLEDFVNVIEQLHEVIVHNMVSKFENVRHEARLGRNELLRDASEDLCAMRAESVEHFNKLVDLEAEYATAGRSLIHGSEDWLKINRELTKEMKTAVEIRPVVLRHYQQNNLLSSKDVLKEYVYTAVRIARASDTHQEAPVQTLSPEQKDSRQGEFYAIWAQWAAVSHSFDPMTFLAQDSIHRRRLLDEQTTQLKHLKKFEAGFFNAQLI
ncbi:hypothetical protein ONZ51_g1700 [Trametes cubensis]|uniref:Uncharacterized protein n=1 Tax=Trametes cubensis TaxID=1111947 RepID=A0AAD7XFJ8_9APHY|nr:hypothetical protein ONZ51_g1700 [Trametes cubensis]